MGCRTSKSGPAVIVVQPPDDPVRIRLRLRGAVDALNGDTLLAKICEITDQFANRFQVSEGELPILPCRRMGTGWSWGD